MAEMPTAAVTVKRQWDRAPLDIFRDVCAAVCFLAVALAVVKLIFVMDALEPRLIQTTENVDRLIVITGGAMTNLEKATRSLKKQEDAEALSIEVLSGKFSTVAENAGAAVTRLSTVLASVDALVVASNRNEGRLTDDAEASLKELRPVLASLNTELEQLPLVTQNLNALVVETTPVLKNAQVITANAAAVTGDLKTLADHYTRQIMAPVNKMKAAAAVVAKYVVEFLGYATGTHF